MGIILSKKDNLKAFTQIPVGTIFVPNDGNDVYIKVGSIFVSNDVNIKLLQSSQMINHEDFCERLFNSVCLSDGALTDFNPKDLVSPLKEDFCISRDLFD